MKKIFVIGSIFFATLHAQEKIIPKTIYIFEDLIQKLYIALDSKHLSKEEIYKLHDILGSLKICQPLIQTSLHHRTIPEKDFTGSLVPPLSSLQTIHLSLEELEKIKGNLFHLLNEKSIEASQLEATYTMIGTINLCLPILKGTSLLIEQMDPHKSHLSEDHNDAKENKDNKEIGHTPTELTPPHSKERVPARNPKSE